MRNFIGPGSVLILMRNKRSETDELWKKFLECPVRRRRRGFPGGPDRLIWAAFRARSPSTSRAAGDRPPAVHTKWHNLVGEEDYGDLFQGLYIELKQMARAQVSKERPGLTLNATALVHEAWLRLEKSAPAQWRDRSQFFASAAEAMRRILVEAARRRGAAKRGSGQVPVSVEGLEVEDRPDDRRLMEVNEVLDELEAEDPIKAAIVKMRFFCGLENEEIAAVLEVNEKTVRRHWELAKVWLYRAIREES
ncbi:MAG: hypothetical protein RLZZ522_405 [Verrucomicrobiota bacterium]